MVDREKVERAVHIFANEIEKDVLSDLFICVRFLF